MKRMYGSWLLIMMIGTMFLRFAPIVKAVEPQYIANFPPGQRIELPPQSPPRKTENGPSGTSLLLNEPVTTTETPVKAMEISLKKAIGMINDGNPTISSAEQEIRMARRDKQAASAARMPVFSLQAMAKDTNVGERWLDLGVTGELIRDINADSAAIGGVKMEVPIYLGGLLDSSEKMAEKGEAIAKINKKRVVQQTIYNVISYYLDILVEQNAVKLEETRFEQKMQEIHTAKEKASERFALKQQVLALELEANEIRQDRLTHQNNLKIARNKLLNELGLSSDVPLQVSPKVGILEISYTENEAVKIAAKQNPNLQILFEKTGLAREQINLAASDEKPKINFNWAYFHTYPFENPDNQYDEWEATLQGKINIFDGGRARNKRLKEVESLRKEEVNLKSATQQIELRLREAFNRYREAKKLLKSLDDNIALAREMLRFVDERVTARVLLKDALLKAQVDLLDTQQAKFVVHATLLKARAAIYMLTGDLTVDRIG